MNKRPCCTNMEERERKCNFNVRSLSDLLAYKVALHAKGDYKVWTEFYTNWYRRVADGTSKTSLVSLRDQGTHLCCICETPWANSGGVYSFKVRRSIGLHLGSQTQCTSPVQDIHWKVTWLVLTHGGSAGGSAPYTLLHGHPPWSCHSASPGRMLWTFSFRLLALLFCCFLAFHPKAL